jgi:A/G-specific adenine glycosylase
MLQQTRVAAVVDHYNEFLRRFPTLVSLALAPEADVLAAWSGLGYYRRARMLHKAAQFILLERDGRLPVTSTELRTLPGIGEYTAAAIASIAFGEPIAVLDGNVERVLLRVTAGPPAGVTPSSAAGRAFVRATAQSLIPPVLSPAGNRAARTALRSAPKAWSASDRIALAAAAEPAARPTGTADYPAPLERNPAGDHNQAMMELGATICLPRAPLCLQCPVYALCRTRGEHATTPRPPQLSRPIAFLLELRKRGPATEVLLERRPADASLMPAMYELPPLPLDAIEGREPILRVRHAITQTNYYVQVYSPLKSGEASHRAPSKDLHWIGTARLTALPLTGLARKILQRLKVMDSPRLAVLE